MSEFCRHGNYVTSDCKTCKAEADAKNGEWYLRVFNTSDRAEVPDECVLCERTPDINNPKKIAHFGHVPTAQAIADAYNKLLRERPYPGPIRAALESSGIRIDDFAAGILTLHTRAIHAENLLNVVVPLLRKARDHMQGDLAIALAVDVALEELG